MAPQYNWANNEEASTTSLQNRPSFVAYFPNYKLQIFLLCVVLIIIASYFWRKCKRFRRRTLLSKVERLDYCDCRILRPKSIPGAVWLKRQCPLHRTRPWTVATELQCSVDSRQYDPGASLDSGFYSP